MSTVDFNIEKLSARYDEFIKEGSLPEKKRDAWLKKQWLTASGHFMSKSSFFERFKFSCCFTRTKFKNKYNISLKKAEKNLLDYVNTLDLTLDAKNIDISAKNIDTILKISKSAAMIYSFKAYKYRNSKKNALKYAFVSDLILKLDQVILNYSQLNQEIQKTKDKLHEPQQVGIRKMLFGTTKAEMERCVGNAEKFRANAFTIHAQIMSVDLINKLNNVLGTI